MIRALVVRIATIVCLVAPLAGQVPSGSEPAYRHVASFPAVSGGRPFVSFAFDRRLRRLFGGSDKGLYWLDVDQPNPVWNGPVLKGIRIQQLQCAPDLRRLFLSTLDDVRYVDVDQPLKAQILVKMATATLAYEPQRHEVYVSRRGEPVRIFNAATGAPTGTIDPPETPAYLLDAIPGKVFVSMSTKHGLYAIDAATHTMALWPVEGKVDWPAPIEVDPTGRYIFAATYQGIAVIDVATAKVIGRIDGQATPSIAFDPDTRLLIATWPNDPPPIRVRAYRVDEKGLTQVAEMENPARGRFGVRHTGRGFIQNGGTEWLLWSLVPPR